MECATLRATLSCIMTITLFSLFYDGRYDFMVM